MGSPAWEVDSIAEATACFPVEDCELGILGVSDTHVEEPIRVVIANSYRVIPRFPEQVLIDLP